MMDEYSRALGAVVRGEVAAQALSTTQVVERLGMSYPSYRRYFITGHRSPDVRQLLAVALGLGMSSLTELFQRVDERISLEQARATARVATRTPESVA